MYLLLGDKAELINVEEAALLLMAACCHDLGMLMGENEEEELNAQAKKENGDWKYYFERHPNDRKKLDSPEGCHEVVINYVRENHHIRVEKIMDSKGAVPFMTGRSQQALSGTVRRTWHECIFDGHLGWASGLYVKP